MSPLDSFSTGHDHSSVPFIVVVNDDEVQGEILRNAASHLPASVEAYLDVPTALDSLSALPLPDLIITDLYMPGIDGWRFTRLLRSREYHRYNDVPILVTSATFAGDDPARITRETSASGFLSLPASPETILDTYRTVLRGDRIETETPVLLVDDDRTTLLLLKHAFTNAGYVVQAAQTVAEASSSLEKGGLDGVILDYHLPDSSGDEVLRRFAGRSDAVFVMLTAESDSRLALQWMEAGASAYLHKPVDPALVVEMYRRASRERALLRIEERLEDRTREVERLLAEERLLTREIHHRVKNNLAAVSALISLRETAIDDPTAQGVLVQTRHDVDTVADIYESLFQSEDNRMVDAAHHLSNLVAQATSQYPTVAATVREELEPVFIDPTTAMRVGIIVNELVTNAMKYAFPDGRTGSIAIGFQRAAGRCTLRVADDGVGIAEDGAGEHSGPDRFGLQMVALMARQMEATLEVSTDGGTEVVIRDIRGGCGD